MVDIIFRNYSDGVVFISSINTKKAWNMDVIEHKLYT
jgi:hypothetical protein